MLEPGQNIRPVMTEEQAIQLVSDLYSFKVDKVREKNAYDDKNYRIKVASEHGNPHIESVCPSGYILKVMNSMDSQKTHCDAEHEAVVLLKEAGIVGPQPVKNVHGKLKSLQNIVYQSDDKTWMENNKSSSGEPGQGLHIVRLLTYVPGKILHEVPYTPRLLHQVGQQTAKIHHALKDWHHKALEDFESMWSLASVPSLSKFVDAVKDEHNHALSLSVIQAFQEQVTANYEHFNKGVIHGDINEQNILVTSQPVPVADSPHVEHDICGIIDYGDMHRSAYIYEVAIAIAYMMVESEVVDRLEVGGHVLAGYLSSGQMTIPDAEFDVLKLCVAGRLCQSLVMGAYSFEQDPSNEYVVTTSKKGWKTLEDLYNTPKEDLYAKWRKVMQK